MPLPEPRDDEQKDNFIDRCMGNDVAVEDFPDESQRRDVCESQWDEQQENVQVMGRATGEDALKAGYTMVENEHECGASLRASRAQHPEIVRNAEANGDPTRTTTLRKRWSGKMGKRFRTLKGIIRENVVELDVLGLKDDAPNPLPNVRRRSYLQENSAIQTNQNILEASPRLNPEIFARDPNKNELFMQWLRDINETTVLDIEEVTEEIRVGQGPRLPSEDPRWTDKWVRRSYVRGVERADVQVRKLGVSVPQLSSVQGLVNAPIHASKLETLFSRSFEELRGVTKSMEQQITRELADGVAQGINPREMARNINNRVDKVGLTRARTLARTEVVRAHNEAALTRYEEMGFNEVRGRAEWLTAGDSRVCFPEYTKVETEEGQRSIEDVREGKRVVTRNGMKQVVESQQREYNGDMVYIETEDGHGTIATEDHPFWTLEKGFLEGSEIDRGQTLQTVDNDLVKVRRTVDFGLTQSADLPTTLAQILIFLRIAFLNIFMPILPIGFYSDTKRRNHKVNDVISHLSFLLKVNIQSLKRFTDSLFNRSFALVGSVAGAATKSASFFLGRLNTKFDLAFPTFHRNGRTAAFFRAMSTVQSTFNIRSRYPELFSALFTFLIVTFAVFHTTIIRTVGITMGYGPIVDREFFGATRTYFGYAIFPVAFVAFAVAKPSSITVGVELFSAVIARLHRSFATILRVAFMGTVSIVASIFLCLVVFFKLFTAKVTGKRKWNRQHPLSMFRILYHLWTRTSIKVYDISVADKPEFYANGILVHNCPRCAGMEGTIFDIESARGLIPLHPNCRCTFAPITRLSRKNLQRQIKTQRLAGIGPLQVGTAQ